MKNSAPMKKLIVAVDSLDTLSDRIGNLMVQALPVGQEVLWTHGERNRLGTVVDHAKFGHRIKVRGASGRQYWIHLRRVIPR